VQWELRHIEEGTAFLEGAEKPSLEVEAPGGQRGGEIRRLCEKLLPSDLHPEVDVRGRKRGVELACLQRELADYFETSDEGVVITRVSAE